MSHLTSFNIRQSPRGASLWQRVPCAPLLLVMATMLLASGCSGYRNYREAQVSEATGNWDDAVLRYLELLRLDPSNLEYKAALMRAKISAAHQHFGKAKDYKAAGLLGQALVELQQAVALDPTNQYAKSELQKVIAEVEARERGSRAETIDEMKTRMDGARAQPPVLSPRSPEPIDLSFPEPRPSMQIYQALGKAFGINILFDPKMRDQDVAIELKDVTAQDALEILMRTAGHFYKVLDEHSIIIVADTPQNRRTYEDLIIQTFFLSNSDVKEVMNQLRSLVDARKIATNESLNAIILRDTADKVKVAERIIKANDKAKAEVVVDVELLQLNTSKLQDLGLSLSASQIGATLDTGGEGIPLRFNDIQHLNGNNWLLTLPNFMFDFVKNSTDAQTLAKPQLRISEGEQARLRIGDRVPVPVTSFNTANTVGSNVVPITSFQYQDVGILIEIEPRVHHNEEISLKVSIEVSNIAGSVGDQPIIGSRNIETTIRLQDGETNFLAGLIRTDETNSDSGIPGISDIPLLGRLFSKKRSSNQRTDIVLTLTPHIIRRASITEEDLLPIWVGTESNITFRGGSPSVESDAQGPFEDEAPSDDAEEMRQRLQRLPRGLRPPADPPAEDGENPAEEPRNTPAQGQELIPSLQRNPLDRRDPPEFSSKESPEFSSKETAPSGAWSRSVPTSLLELLPSMGLASAQPLSLQETQEGPSASTASTARPKSTARSGVRDTPEVDIRLLAPALVAIGEEFTVEILVEHGEGLAHLPARLSYDPALVELVGAEAGAWFASGGQSQVLAARSATSEIVVGASRLAAAQRLEGGGDVAKIRFRALAPAESGTTEIRLTEAQALSRGQFGMASRSSRDRAQIRIVSERPSVDPGRDAPP